MKMNKKYVTQTMLLALAAFGVAVTSADVNAAHPKRMVLPAGSSSNGTDAGGTCGTPTAFAATPFNDTGDTTGAANVISSIATGCSDYSTVAGPEAIYSFVAGTGASVTFNVAGTTTLDPSIYLVTTCNSGATCVTGADYNYGPGTAETFTASALTAGTTYYLHIDSYYGTGDPAPYNTYSQGPYTLAVTGTLPVSLQEFTID